MGCVVLNAFTLLWVQQFRDLRFFIPIGSQHVIAHVAPGVAAYRWGLPHMGC